MNVRVGRSLKDFPAAEPARGFETDVNATTALCSRPKSVGLEVWVINCRNRSRLSVDKKQPQHNRDGGTVSEGRVAKTVRVNAAGEVPHASCSGVLPRHLQETDKAIGAAAKKTRWLLSTAMIPLPDEHQSCASVETETKPEVMC